MDDHFARRISGALGLMPLPSWPVDLPKAIEQICRARGVTPQQLEQRLKNDPAALRELGGLLTVGETYFLRETPHFDVIVRHLMEARARGGPLIVWSAGCSSGEEPYSIAMCVARSAPHIAREVHIIGSDISREALEKARRGVYSGWSFRGAPQWVLDYFRPVEGGGDRGAKQLHPSIRARVELVEESIQGRIASSATASVDVIVFRNVSIYLNGEALASIYAGLRRVLRGDGLLVVGAGDVRPASQLFRPIASEISGLYTPRADGDEEPAAWTPPPAPPPTPMRRRATQPSTPSTAMMTTIAREPAQAIEASAPPSLSSALARHATALERADRGDLRSALEIVGRQIEEEPDDPSGYLVRGQIQLAAEEVDKAVSDLRRVVFLRPGDRIARYWLSVALKAAGLPDQAATHLADLKRRLQTAADTDILEDGSTPASELRATVDHDLEALS